jgi:hypothetical protein
MNVRFVDAAVGDLSQAMTYYDTQRESGAALEEPIATVSRRPAP